ncbi:inositol monophosphatase family protein [Nanoarchaeota archaeon]
MEEKIKKILVSGVISAGKEILKYKGQGKQEATKITAFDYGIPADKQAEKIILDSISKTNLKVQIISEESGIKGDSQADYKIYVDALDGSVNFSRNIPAFCVGLALFYKNNPLLGIIYDPNTDELFIAEKGKGTTVNGEKIQSKTNKKNALINVEWFGAPNYESVIEKLKKANLRARTSGSGVLALCYGVIGRGDGAVLISNNPWDIAPGMVFAEEMGCEIKQFNGEPVNLSQKRIDVIAAPKDVFDMIFNTLK